MSSESVIEAAGLAVREAPVRIVLNLRGRPDDTAFALAVNEATGMMLPAPNRFTASGARLLAWLGPDEFLLMDSDGDIDGDVGNVSVSDVEQSLRQRLPAATSALTRVSAGFTTLQVSGERARDFLARGWTLDLHPAAFGIGECAQSSLSKAPALLLHRDAPPVFEIVVRRSYAVYLRAWLTATADAWSQNNER